MTLECLEELEAAASPLPAEMRYGAQELELVRQMAAAGPVKLLKMHRMMFPKVKRDASHIRAMLEQVRLEA